MRLSLILSFASYDLFRLLSIFFPLRPFSGLESKLTMMYASSARRPVMIRFFPQHYRWGLDFVSTLLIISFTVLVFLTAGLDMLLLVSLVLGLYI